LEYIDGAIRQIKQLVRYIAEQFGKQVSVWTLKRFLKAAGYRYKRMRRSLKSKRDEVLFDFFQHELKHLQQLGAAGEIDLIYFDEAGINLTPVIPYAWQPKGERYLLPSCRSENLTVLGFMNQSGQCYSFLFEGAASGTVVTACIDAFAEQITKKTVVILDQASIHTCKQVWQKIPEWQQKGLYLQFIPPYCPELNLIEILWKFIKYYWLDLRAYQSIELLKEEVIEVLKNIGTKYQVNFT
jgi:transposase